MENDSVVIEIRPKNQNARFVIEECDVRMNGVLLDIKSDEWNRFAECKILRSVIHTDRNDFHLPYRILVPSE